MSTFTRRITIGLMLITAAYIGVSHFLRGRSADVAYNAASTFRISDNEMEAVRVAALAGNCPAAYRLARHFSFFILDFDSAVVWLRVAAKCPDTNAKSELVYTLLGTKNPSDHLQEIERLIQEIQAIDPNQAQVVKEEVEFRQSGATTSVPDAPTFTPRSP